MNIRKARGFAVFAAMAALSFFATANAATVREMNNQVQVYAGSSKLDYQEIDNYGQTGTGILDSEKGSQTAFGIKASAQVDFGSVNNVYLEAGVRSAHGTTRYDGYLQDTSGASPTLIPYSAGGTKAKIMDLSLKIGKGFVLAFGNQQLTPFVGLAYRTWVRDSSGSDFGYREDYSHSTASLGLRYQVMVLPKTMLEAEAAMGKTMSPQMKLVADGSVYKLKTAGTSDVHVGVVQLISQHVSMHFNVDRKAFKYGESPSVNGFYEPESKTTETALSVGVGFSF